MIGEEKNPYENGVNVFKNNPYVDGFADSVQGEIFHDQYLHKECTFLEIVG